MSLLEKISDRPLCADGGINSALRDRGILPTFCAAELCICRPEIISEIHASYLNAGARILRTNSLGANPVQLARQGMEDRVNEINWQASQLARQAAKNSGAEVAGRVGPLGISASEALATGIDREECLSVQIGALLDGGATLIWFEGFHDSEELLLALNAKHALHHCPAICSLAVPEPPSPRESESASFVKSFQALLDHDAEILGLDGDDTAKILLLTRKLSTTFSTTGGETPLAILSGSNDTPEQFASFGLQLAAAGARILGGTDCPPTHIAALSSALTDHFDATSLPPL